LGVRGLTTPILLLSLRSRLYKIFTREEEVKWFSFRLIEIEEGKVINVAAFHNDKLVLSILFMRYKVVLLSILFMRYYIL